MNARPLPYFLCAGILFAVYFGTAKAGLLIYAVSGLAAPVWPPTGIALVAITIGGFRLWPALALAALAVNVSAGAPVPVALGMATGNTLEALLGTYLLRRVVRFRITLSRIQDVLGLVFLAAGVSTTVSATVGVTSGWLAGVFPTAEYGAAWFTWWLGDMMGDLVVAPLLFTCLANRGAHLPWRRALEAAGLLACLVGVGLFVFANRFDEAITHLKFLIFPLLIWAALRFGPGGAAAAICVISTLAVGGTIQGLGPYGAGTLHERLLLLQGFLGVITVTMLVMAASASESLRNARALRESEARYRQLVELNPDAVFVCADDHIVYANPATASMFGVLTPRHLLGRCPWNQLPAASGGAIRERYRQVLETGKPAPLMEQTWLSVEGRTVEVEATARRFPWHGKPALEIVLHNVTERQRAYAAKEEQARLVALVADVGTALAQNDTLADALRGSTEAFVRHLGAALVRIWIANDTENLLELHASAGMYTHLNGGHARIPVGKYKIGLIAQERRSLLTNQVLGDPRVHDQEWAKREGIVAFAGHPLVVEDRLVGVIGLFARQPLTELALQAMASVAQGIALGIERKRAEEALRESEERFRRIYESNMIAIQFADACGSCTDANEAFCRLIGYTPGEVRARQLHWRDLVPPEFAVLNDRAQKERETTGVCTPFETEFIHKEGHRVPVLLGGALLTGTKVRSVTFALDLTERNRMMRQVLQAERLAAIGQMVTGLAHESGNALQRIQVCQELLAPHLQAWPETLDLLTDMQQAQDHLRHLYKEVRLFAAPLHLGRQVCHLGLILEEAWQHLGVIRRDRATQLRQLPIPPDLDLTCAVDPTSLGQVFRNMLENSLAASADPVVVEARWSATELDGAPALCLALRDNGVGLTPEARRSIFEPFYTTKTSGTGLGMAIAKRIVDAHGGRITVGEDMHPGAEILVTLPRGMPCPKHCAS